MGVRRFPGSTKLTRMVLSHTASGTGWEDVTGGATGNVRGVIWINESSTSTAQFRISTTGNEITVNPSDRAFAEDVPAGGYFTLDATEKIQAKHGTASETVSIVVYTEA